MLTESLVPLTIVLALVALVTLAGSVLLWRGAGRLTRRLEPTAEYLEDRAHLLPTQISIGRATLAERSAAIEHALWTLGRADDQIDDLTASLAARRRSMDSLRGHIVRSRDTVERLKTAFGLIMRAIELRRTILG